MKLPKKTLVSRYTKAVRLKMPQPNILKGKFDVAAQVYLKSDMLLKEAAADRDVHKEKVVEFIESDKAEETEKGRRFEGIEYVGRLTTIRNSPTVDIALLKKLYPSLSKRIIKTETVEVIDDEALGSAIEKGLIQVKHAKKLLVDGGIRGTRFSVGLKTEEQQDE